MTDLVVLSLEAWDAVWRRNQHLVAGLLRTDPELRVLFVEPAADPLHSALRRSRPTRGRGVRPGPPLDGIPPDALTLYEPTKLLPRRVDSRADQRAARAVERAALDLGFAEPVLWVNDPDGAYVLERTGWPALYDVTDDWLEADRPHAEHDRLIHDEAVLLERCEEVVVCSPQLAKTKGAKRSVTLIPNAVDVAAYRVPAARPADLPDGPVAVYVGTIHTDRIDVSLCAATARALGRAGQLVMVGPAPLSAADRQRLLDAGVVLLGPKDRVDVPGYLQHADVLVVPHLVTPFTDSLDPIKVYEYSAVGRPVVSTPVAGFRELTETEATIASGEEFIAAVSAAIPAVWTFPSGADRPVASWSDRVADMRQVIERLSSS